LVRNLLGVPLGSAPSGSPLDQLHYIHSGSHYKTFNITHHSQNCGYLMAWLSSIPGLSQIFTCNDCALHSTTLETQCKQGMTAPKDLLHESQLVIRCLRTFILPLPFSFLSFLSFSFKAVHWTTCYRRVPQAQELLAHLSNQLFFCSVVSHHARASQLGFLLFCPFFLVGGCFLPCPSLIGWRYTANPFRVSRVLVLGVQSSPARFHPTTNQDTSSGFTST
jgi:hypothetical protein